MHREKASPIWSLIERSSLSAENTHSRKDEKHGVTRAYKTVIIGAPNTPQNVVSSTVQLSVGNQTRLLLNVTRDHNSTWHVSNAQIALLEGD